MRITCTLVLLGIVNLLPSTALGQSRSDLNPEISFIADARALAADATPGDLEFVFHALEIAATTPLNPFATGAIFVGLHDGAVELEEGYVDFSALPGNLGLRAGQFLVDQGRFNRYHAHTYSFLDAPQVVSGFFGDEGLRGVGINPSWLLGLGDVAITVSGSAVTTEGEHGHSDAGSTEGDREEPRFLKDLTYTGRASAFVPLGDVTNLDLGGGGGTRVLDPADGVRSTWLGVDAKLKWRPDTRRSVTIAAEFISHRQDLEEVAATKAGSDEAETATGVFAYVDWQFRKQWNLGGLLDHAQAAEDASHDRTGLGVFAGFTLFEESTLVRLLVRRDSATGAADATSVQLQLVSSLGPHRPHQF